jgi:hypothetical protein
MKWTMLYINDNSYYNIMQMYIPQLVVVHQFPALAIGDNKSFSNNNARSHCLSLVVHQYSQVTLIKNMMFILYMLQAGELASLALLLYLIVIEESTK